MDITQWYAIALGSLVALFFLSHHLMLVARISRTDAASYLLKRLFYPPVHRYLRGLIKTRFDVILLIAFLAGNITCLGLEARNVAGLVAPSGVMATINLVPLALGEHMNLIANRCGVGVEAYARMHEWLGRVAIAECLIHAAAAASSTRLDLRTKFGVEALVAASVAGAILLTSVAFVRRHFHEIFQKLHFILAPILIAAIYLHVPSKKLFASPVVYLFAAICVQISTVVMRLGHALYRNVGRGKHFSRAQVRAITYKTLGSDIPISDAVHVHIRLSRPWIPQAGQYVYVCIPGVRLVQIHPFFVSWWYRDGDGDTIVLIVRKRKGFTQDLFSHVSDVISPSWMRTIVEGPYGKELNLESYGTVLLFATDIGIAGQLPYVRRLLDGYHDGEVKTQRITLFWELESEVDASWVADMMKELLQKDTDKVLNIQLFVLGNYLSSETQPEDSVPLGKRITMAYKAMDAKQLIISEISGRKGRTVVSSCTNDETSDRIRKAVQGMTDNAIDLKELEYHPHSHRERRGRLGGMA